MRRNRDGTSEEEKVRENREKGKRDMGGEQKGEAMALARRHQKVKRGRSKAKLALLCLYPRVKAKGSPSVPWCASSIPSQGQKNIKPGPHLPLAAATPNCPYATCNDLLSFPSPSNTPIKSLN